MEREQQMRAIPLAQVWRGNLVENSHIGHAAVVDADGRLLAWAGDPGAVTYMRSAAKPVQALPAVMRGVLEQYGWGEEELALMTASHRGDAAHIAVLERMLATSGITESELALPETLMLGESSRERLLRSDGERRRIYHNCAGKHLGLLALCDVAGWPRRGYAQPEHPLQQEILMRLAALSGEEEKRVVRATDGCGFPVFALPIWRIALIYARLASPTGVLDDVVRQAAVRTTAAMLAQPALVEGEGRLATTLLTGGMLAKSGAQGVFAIGLPQLRLGLAVKLLDGTEAAMPQIVSALLRSLAASRHGAGAAEDLLALAVRVDAAHHTIVHNDAGAAVGRIEPVVHLAYGEGPRFRRRSSDLA